jgi:sarcosine oxidase
MPESEWDVAVVGLGAMGSHTLWRLAARGARVIGIEQFEPGHDRGASHGESRIFRTAYMEGSAYVPLMRAARALWAQLEVETGASIVIPTGCLSIGPPGSRLVAGAAEAAAEHGLPHSLLTPAQLAERWPQHAGLPPDAVALYEPDAGVLRPELAVRSAVSAAIARGATVLSGTHVESVGDGVVRLADREITARHVVVAAGGWSLSLLPRLGVPLRPVRRVQGWFTAPPSYGPEQFPVFLRETGDTVWYGLPALDGRTAKVAVHHAPGLNEPVDPSVGPRPPDALDADRLAELIRPGLPGLDPAPVRMLPCTYSLTPDENFAIGRYADHTTALAGFSGHGFKFAPRIGEIAADLALTGATPADLTLFAPHRRG